MMALPDQAPPGAARLAYFTPVREYPPLADRKASFLLAAYGLMVSVLLGFSGAIEATVFESSRAAACAILAVLAPLSTLILLGAWNAFHALTRPMPPMPDCLAFYPRIAALSLGDYRERVKALDHPRALAAILHYNYSLATLSVAKFRLVDRSLACARWTFELWMVLLLMIALLR